MSSVALNPAGAFLLTTRLTEIGARCRSGRLLVPLAPRADRYDDLLPGERESLAPRAVVAAVRSISKPEVLARPPCGTRSLVTFAGGP